jgi:hypothetical protein
MRPLIRCSLNVSRSVFLFADRDIYITIELWMVTLSSLLDHLTYHLETFFRSSTYVCSVWSFRSTPPMWELQSDTTTCFTTSLPLLTDTRISSVGMWRSWSLSSYHARSELLWPVNADQTVLPFSGVWLSPREERFLFVHRVPTQCFIWLQKTCQFWRIIKIVSIQSV